MFFIDSQHGWLSAQQLVGPYSLTTAPPAPSLYATADGGRDWRLVSHYDGCPFRFTSLSVGWSGGDGCGLTRTQDGGVTWTPVQLKLPCPCSAFDLPVFLDQSRGVVDVVKDVISGNTETVSYFIALTTDGGNTWHSPSKPFATSYVGSIAIDYEDADNLWDLAYPPGWYRGAPDPRDWLYHSADGGETWTLVQRDTPLGSPSEGSPTSLWFADPSHGFAVQGTAAGGVQLLTTSDGGHSWHVIRMQMS